MIYSLIKEERVLFFDWRLDLEVRNFFTNFIMSYALINISAFIN